MPEISCEICYLEFESNDGLISHIILLHEGETLNIVGTDSKIVLSRVNPDQGDGKENGVVENSSEGKEQPVTKCDKKKSNVTKVKARKEYKCDKCPKVFLSDSGLYWHNLGHDGILKKRFKCTHCEEKFAKHSDLSKHLWEVHDGLANHECRICMKGFISKSDKTRHMRSIHEGIPRKDKLRYHQKNKG